MVSAADLLYFLPTEQDQFYSLSIDAVASLVYLSMNFFVSKSDRIGFQ